MPEPVMICWRGVAANEIMDATIGHTTVDTGLFKAAMFVNPTVGIRSFAEYAGISTQPIYDAFGSLNQLMKMENLYIHVLELDLKTRLLK